MINNIIFLDLDLAKFSGTSSKSFFFLYMRVIFTLEIYVNPENILAIVCGGSVRLENLTIQSVEPAVIRHPSVICIPVIRVVCLVE